ncbi:MAG: NTP transferase domain-containing protein [Gammaproteobacteria bacterium]
MQAIILAAGVGRRLQQAGGDKPKSLLSFGGKTLLQRHITNLQRAGVEVVCIVIGHQGELIEAALQEMRYDIDVETRRNPDYTLGSVVSLHHAAAVLQGGSDIILMDADVLYDFAVLARLLDSEHRNCLLLDEKFEPGDEPVKICVADGRIVEFRKQIDNNVVWDQQGESVGFFRFDAAMAVQLAQRVEYYVGNDLQQAPYEDVIRDLILQQADRFNYENITGLPWIEIDFPDDIERAQAIVLKQLGETE